MTWGLQLSRTHPDVLIAHTPSPHQPLHSFIPDKKRGDSKSLMKDSGWVWQVYCFTGNQIPPSAGTVSFRRLQRNIKSFSNYWMRENNLNHAPPLVIFFSSVIYETRNTKQSAHQQFLITNVKTPRSHPWKCHIWWDAVKIFSVSPQDAGCPLISRTAEDIHESYKTEDKITCPSFGGGALSAVLPAPSSVEMVNEYLVEHNCSILCSDSYE